jgi:hypothetical protein
MDSSILFVARSVTAITALALIAYLIERRRRRLPMLSRWILWFAMILLMNIAIQGLPASPVRIMLVIVAWALFLVFLPGFLRNASAVRSDISEESQEAAELIAAIVALREQAGRPVIRIDCIDRDGRSRVVYQCEKARQEQ